MIQLPDGLAKEHLQKACCKGDVLFWKDFPGKEKSRDSYFVLLTNCIKDRFICARATAQTHHYLGPTARRLTHDIVLIKAGETPLFFKNTILDLNWIEYFTVDQLCKLLGSNIGKKGRLSSNIIKRIDDRVRIATTISQRDQKLILQS